MHVTEKKGQKRGKGPFTPGGEWKAGINKFFYVIFCWPCLPARFVLYLAWLLFASHDPELYIHIREQDSISSRRYC